MDLVDYECLDLVLGNVISILFRAKMLIIDHLIDFALALEKYKAVQIFPCRKIKIRRTTTFIWGNLIP